MWVMKKFGFLVFLATASLVLQNAAGSYLPPSSYEDGAWQGYSIYKTDGFDALIQYAVYDTGNMTSGTDEYNLAAQLDLTGQFLYAYQIFNIGDQIASFGLLDIDGLGLDESSMFDTGSYDDGSEGVGPIDPSAKQGLWEFEYGVLIANKHSWLLILSSDQGPVKGSYSIKGFDEGEDIATPSSVPEPGTILLLGLGGMFFRRRKKRIG